MPSNWEHMRVNLTCNDNIKTFDDVACHLELEEDRLLADKPAGEIFMTEFKAGGASNSKRKGWKAKGKGPKNYKAASLVLIIIRLVGLVQRKTNAKEASVVVRKIRKTKNATTVASRVTSLVIALSRR